MASPNEIWLTDFGDPHPGEPAHHRPALILGPPDYFGPDFPFTIVAPLTTTQRGLSLHVEIEPTPSSGLDHTSYVQCELLRSINKTRLIHQLGSINPDTNTKVRTIAATLLGL